MKRLGSATNWLLIGLLMLPVTEAMAANKIDWIRFLEQASFGPTPALIDSWQASDPAVWLKEQQQIPATRFSELAPFPANQNLGCPTTDPNVAQCRRDNYTMYPLQVQFFNNALAAPDQLRQRVAYTLSQIFVVSGLQIRQPSSMVPYLNILVDGALGNFRDLLEKITLNAAMGDYLDMVNNNKPSSDGRIQPNENYAREVLQLFTLGLYQLNVDGTPKLGGDGTPLPAYDQSAIEGFAHAFTGWTYATQPGATPKARNPAYYIQPMEVYRSKGVDINHDKLAKHLLSYPGARFEWLSAGQTAETDLSQALDNIFNHPNVGPFIGTQLIQSLVTSNPSRAYIARVARVFNNNGSGVRGDLFATVRAVLLDPEARGASAQPVNYGRLREPVLFLTGLLRGLEANSDGILANQTKAMGQDIFNAPSVFSYYPRPYQVPGTTLQGPEFGIESSSATVSRHNLINTLVYSRINSAAPATGTEISWARLDPLGAQKDSGPLLEYLNTNLLHGSMPAAMKSIIAGSLTCSMKTGQTECSNARDRAKTALYLVATSAAYQIQR